MNEQALVASGGNGAELPVSQEVLDVFSTVPRNFEGVMVFCDMLAKSDLVPKDYKDKPANVMVAIQCGAEIGLSAMQAIQNIAVINGRPSLWGDAPLGLVQGSGKLEWIKETADGETAICETKRRGYPQSHKTTFSQADAVKMGLAGKPGPWSQVPGRMRQLRARAFNLRDQFADVLKGVSVAEEVMDITPHVQVEPEPPKPVTQEEKGAAVRERMKAKAGAAGATAEGGPPAAPPAPASTEEVSDSTWADFVAYMDESPERSKILKTVKDKFKVKSVSEIGVGERRAFIDTAKDEAKRLGLTLQ
jgi:hypothetical protein